MRERERDIHHMAVIAMLVYMQLCAFRLHDKYSWSSSLRVDPECTVSLDLLINCKRHCATRHYYTLAVRNKAQDHIITL